MLKTESSAGWRSPAEASQAADQDSSARPAEGASAGGSPMRDCSDSPSAAREPEEGSSPSEKTPTEAPKSQSAVDGHSTAQEEDHVDYDEESDVELVKDSTKTVRPQPSKADEKAPRKKARRDSAIDSSSKATERPYVLITSDCEEGEVADVEAVTSTSSAPYRNTRYRLTLKSSDRSDRSDAVSTTSTAREGSSYRTTRELEVEVSNGE